MLFFWPLSPHRTAPKQRGPPPMAALAKRLGGVNKRKPRALRGLKRRKCLAGLDRLISCPCAAHFRLPCQSLVECHFSLTTDGVGGPQPEVQASRRRHQPRTSPLAKIRPGNPDPTTGRGYAQQPSHCQVPYGSNEGLELDLKTVARLANTRPR
jgi:hypothetical protein